MDGAVFKVSDGKAFKEGFVVCVAVGVGGGGIDSKWCFEIFEDVACGFEAFRIVDAIAVEVIACYDDNVRGEVRDFLDDFFFTAGKEVGLDVCEVNYF